MLEPLEVFGFFGAACCPREFWRAGSWLRDLSCVRWFRVGPFSLVQADWKDLLYPFGYHLKSATMRVCVCVCCLCINTYMVKVCSFTCLYVRMYVCVCIYVYHTYRSHPTYHMQKFSYLVIIIVYLRIIYLLNNTTWRKHIANFKKLETGLRTNSAGIPY